MTYTEYRAGNQHLNDRDCRTMYAIWQRDVERVARAISARWVDRLGFGYHPDTRGDDYSPALSAEWIAEYESDMETLFALPIDPYEFGIDAMHALEKVLRSIYHV